ncbi:MAG: hypothetical protein QF437_10625, partial [Planctomycetota bacterium]|nr:hypothetical protein [Planctomycetota bacterium]
MGREERPTGGGRRERTDRKAKADDNGRDHAEGEGARERPTTNGKHPASNVQLSTAPRRGSLGPA